MNDRVDRACFVVFWGAQNIAGESSLKIPYSTIAVKTQIQYWDVHDVTSQYFSILTQLQWYGSFRVVACYNRPFYDQYQNQTRPLF